MGCNKEKCRNCSNLLRNSAVQGHQFFCAYSQRVFGTKPDKEPGEAACIWFNVPVPGLEPAN